MNFRQAQDVLDELEKWRPAIDKVMKEVIGFTNVNLDGSVVGCRRRECSMGNLLADAMVDYVSTNFTSPLHTLYMPCYVVI